jgi:hypothetical protein
MTHDLSRKGSSRHVPSSAITGFIDRRRIEALLSPWVPDPAAREFVVRCMLGEGPAHHRGANYVLLALLGLLLEKGGPVERAPGAPAAPVPMRVPPSHGEALDELAYPLALALRPLEQLSRGGRDVEAMVDCLTDGPPQHALANAAMVAMIDALLERAGR